MGFVSALLGQDSPISQFVADNRNTIHGAFSGLGTGQNFSDGLSGAARGATSGRAADDAYAISQKAEKQRLDQINATVKYLQSNPAFADLVPIAQAGDGSGALTEAFKRSAPGYGEQTVSPGQTVLDADNKPLYTAPDKPPAAPSGYRYTADGSALEPIPHGPADTTLLSPEALDLVATQFLAGDKSAAVGYARSPAMKVQLTNAIAAKAKEMGLDGKDVAAQISAFAGNVAGQRAAGTRAAQVGIAASEANQMADLAVEASKAVPRGNIVPWNKAVQMVQAGSSSPELAQFVAATTSLVNAYARAVSPSGVPTDQQRQHAEDMLSTAQSPEAYAAVIAQMKKEMVAALNAPAEISQTLKEGITGPTVAADPNADPVAAADALLNSGKY